MYIITEGIAGIQSLEGIFHLLIVIDWLSGYNYIMEFIKSQIKVDFCSL